MKKSHGFTLIETIIYLALFAIVIGGGMVATYQIIQATDANYNHVVLQEEANFLLRKIDWALTGSTDVSVPSSSVLESTKNSTVYTFNICTTNLTIQTGSGKTCSNSPITLNSSNVTVSLTPSIPLFQEITVSGKPDELITSFTLTTVQNGRNATEAFSTTKYLRQ